MTAGDAPCPYCGHLLWFSKMSQVGAFGAFQKFTITDQTIRTRQDAIGAIFNRLAGLEELNLEHRQNILSALLNREELGSTAIGGGVAVPHATYPGLPRLIGAVADFPTGVDFRSLDGKPVFHVYLFVSPRDRPGEYLCALEAISRRLRADP